MAQLAAMESSSSNFESFTLFPRLPTELRLQIWNAALVPRIVEVHLTTAFLCSNSFNQASTIDKTPIARPTLPIILHVCRESRAVALSQYRTAGGTSFSSPSPFPCNLYHPALDTLYVSIALYALRILADRISPAVKSDFVLDYLGKDADAVSQIRSLSISWQDLTEKDVPRLVLALKPFVALQHLILVFSEKRQDGLEVKHMGQLRGKLPVELVDVAERNVRGTYMMTVLKTHMDLAQKINEGFRQVESSGGTRLPLVSAMMCRFD